MSRSGLKQDSAMSKCELFRDEELTVAKASVAPGTVLSEWRQSVITEGMDVLFGLVPIINITPLYIYKYLYSEKNSRI